MKKIILYSILILCISSCSEEPPVFDPCKDESPTTADFTIHEGFGFVIDEWIPYDTDTIATSAAIFTAVEDDETAEYEWTIGSETIRERSFGRTDFPFYTPITVTLKVTKRPKPSCFPDDDGVDIKTRVLYSVPLRETLVFGSYRGINTDEPSKEFDMSIEITDSPIFPDRSIYRIGNLVEGCNLDYDNGFDIPRGYKQIYFGHNNNFDCLRPLGLARIHGIDNDSITIDYSIQTAPGSENWESRINKTFKGKRIE